MIGDNLLNHLRISHRIIYLRHLYKLENLNLRYLWCQRFSLLEARVVDILLILKLTWRIFLMKEKRIWEKLKESKHHKGSKHQLDKNLKENKPTPEDHHKEKRVHLRNNKHLS